jgi:serine/threonine protein kinase
MLHLISWCVATSARSCRVLERLLFVQPTYRFLLMGASAAFGLLAGTLFVDGSKAPTWYARSFYVDSEQRASARDTAWYTVHWFVYAIVTHGTTWFLAMPDMSSVSMTRALVGAAAVATAVAALTGRGYYEGGALYLTLDTASVALPMCVHVIALMCCAFGAVVYCIAPHTLSRGHGLWTSLTAPRLTLVPQAALNVFWTAWVWSGIAAGGGSGIFVVPVIVRTTVTVVVLLATVVLEQRYWAWKADSERPTALCSVARPCASRSSTCGCCRSRRVHTMESLLDKRGEADSLLAAMASPPGGYGSWKGAVNAVPPRGERERSVDSATTLSRSRIFRPYDVHERQADAAVPLLDGRLHDELQATFPPASIRSTPQNGITLYVLSTTDTSLDIAPWHAGTWRPTAGGLELVNRSASAALPSHVAAAVGRARNIVVKRYNVVSRAYGIPCATEHMVMTRLMPGAPSSVVKYLGRVMDASSVSLVFDLCTYGDLSIMLDAVHRDPSSDAAVRRRNAILEHVLTPANRMRMAVQLAEALAHCHVRGVVHCDVKPANVFVDGSFGAVLGDFGHSFALDGAPPQGYRGTPMFSAPETCLRWELSPASDVWSLAVTLWCLFALRPRPEWRTGQVRALEGGSTAGERFTSVPDSSVGSADASPLDGSRGLGLLVEDQGRRLRRGDRPKLPRAARVDARAMDGFSDATAPIALPTDSAVLAVGALGTAGASEMNTAGSVRRTSDLFRGMDDEAAHAIAVLLCRMWATDPSDRPPAAQVVAVLRNINPAPTSGSFAHTRTSASSVGGSDRSLLTRTPTDRGAFMAAGPHEFLLMPSCHPLEDSVVLAAPSSDAVAVAARPPVTVAAGGGGDESKTEDGSAVPRRPLSDGRDGGGAVILVAGGEPGGAAAADRVASLWGAPAAWSGAVGRVGRASGLSQADSSGWAAAPAAGPSVARDGSPHVPVDAGRHALMAAHGDGPQPFARPSTNAAVLAAWGGDARSHDGDTEVLLPGFTSVP